MQFIQLFILLFIAGYVVQQSKIQALVANRKNRKVILDTCALIDGRILELNKAGFVPDQLIIPEFIVHELQLLADGTDSHKRSRARYGLDVVHQLQEDTEATVVIDKTPIPDIHAIDDKLIALAVKLRAPLYTTDYNLGKVAEIQDVKVLNVNELAGALRPTALPGETKNIKIIQKGSGPKQGIGYLEDGTLIVVEEAASLTGKTVEVEITKTHQTSSGKMLFGDLVPVKSLSPHKQSAVSAQSAPRLAARRQSRQIVTRLKKGR
jgi:uncharacterized protein YacL